VGKPKGKRILGRPWHEWEDWIKWIVGRLAGRMLSRFTWLRVGSCEHGDEPSGSGTRVSYILSFKMFRSLPFMLNSGSFKKDYINFLELSAYNIHD
jgi:hypothetical protein